MFTVQILTPEKALPLIEAEHVTLPAVDGELGIRTGHAPVVTLLKAGKVFIKHGSQANHTYAVRGGVAQMVRNELKIISQAVADGDEVSETTLAKRLEALLSAPYADDHAKMDAKAEAAWLATQLQAAGKTVPDLSRLGL